MPHLVKWNDGVTPRVLTSVEGLLKAEANGELTIQKTSNVVNAPIIVWEEKDGKQQVVPKIEGIFQIMQGFKAQVIKVDTDNYVVTIKLILIVVCLIYII